MIFGDNLVSVTHTPSNWTLAFNTADALDAVDKTDKHMLRVAYARDWESTREETTQNIKEVVKPYDWSYSTTYAGTVDGAVAFAPTDKQIPIELLKRRDPILFFDEVVLYESELDDNGISLYSAKLRVHDKRMLLLCRLFMRLDNVLVRLRDTRIYVDFETDEVLREYTAKESKFADVKNVSVRWAIKILERLLVVLFAGKFLANVLQALWRSGRLPDDITVALRDPNALDPFLEVVEHRIEAVSLAAQQ